MAEDTARVAVSVGGEERALRVGCFSACDQSESADRIACIHGCAGHVRATALPGECKDGATNDCTEKLLAAGNLDPWMLLPNRCEVRQLNCSSRAATKLLRKGAKRPTLLKDCRSGDELAALQAGLGDLDELMPSLGAETFTDSSPYIAPIFDQSWRFNEYVRHVQGSRTDPRDLTAQVCYSFMFIAALLLPPELAARFPQILPTPRTADPPRIAYQGQYLGLPFHAHSTLLNEVVRGQKLWMFYPPDFTNETLGIGDQLRYGARSLFNEARAVCCPSSPALNADRCSTLMEDVRLSTSLRWAHRWMHELGGEGKPQRPTVCTQQPGSVMVVPDGWLHATINVDDNIVVQTEL